MGWLQHIFGRRAGVSGDGAPAPAPEVDWRARGNEALRKGDLAAAAQCYAQGIQASPGDPLLRLNHGFALLQLRQFAAAAERLQQALVLRRPTDAFAHEAHHLMGRAYAAAGAHEEALAQFAEAIRLQPDFAAPLEDGIPLLQALGRGDEAAQWAQRLVALRPAEDVDGSLQRFGLLSATGSWPDALLEAERTLRLAGGAHPGALVNMAVALEKLGRCEEAQQRLQEALQLAPDYRGALVNQVQVLTQLLRVDEAIEVARQGLHRYPDDADLHWNLAVCHLLRGDLAEGWRGHEWRLRQAALRHKVSQFDAPTWHGEDLAGRAILLHAEQGFGDHIQFVRYVPQVAAWARQVYLHVAPALHALVAKTLPANCRLVADGDAAPAIDFHGPLLSLPAILGTTVETIPAPMPYLHADPAAAAAWGERLGAGGLKVGIAWAGNPTHGNDHNRSIALAKFRAIAAPGCRFFTVQPEVRAADRAALEDWPEAHHVGSDLRDFADTAALMMALDVVVTVDTSVAHLAGALGKPVWILLPHSPDWRWLLEREDSPWYPTARLYRQGADRAWEPVLARVRADLAALVRG